MKKAPSNRWTTGKSHSNIPKMACNQMLKNTSNIKTPKWRCQVHWKVTSSKTVEIGQMWRKFQNSFPEIFNLDHGSWETPQPSVIRLLCYSCIQLLTIYHYVKNMTNQIWWTWGNPQIPLFGPKLAIAYLMAVSKCQNH